MWQSIFRVALFMLVSSLSAVVTAEPRADAKLNTSIIRDVPHVNQKPDYCGEACAEMWLRKIGYRISQDDVFNQAGLDPELGRGCYTKELSVALRRLGFQTGSVWNRINPRQARQDLNAEFTKLHTDLLAGVPSIVCMHYSDQPNTTEHFRLVTGYDAATDEVIYQEPAIRDGSDQRMSRTMFLELWPLKYSAQQWTVIRFRLESDRIVMPRRTGGFSDSDYAQHILSLKKRLPNPNFHIVLQRPFVVVGDELPATVERRSVQTVKWAVDRIKRDYFARDPDQIIDVWLFKDKTSYEKHTKELFNTEPTTPYGFYTSRHRALIMNISTGGGTLVHEIVHPFMASNFPACPSWFNEGLASLYEQCRDKDGHIWGSTNWRLAGLQKAIKQERVPSFQTLCETSTREFYDEDRGTNYSQARYLCYYLQERGLLQRYYREFCKSAKDDPSGYKTLQQVVGSRDMQQFQEDWQAFVLRLKF